MRRSDTRPFRRAPTCRSFEWDTVESAGQGQIFSFVVTHYPQVPGFDYPLPIGLIELDEGTRLVAGLESDDTSLLRVGQKVEAHMVEYDDALTLPVFRVVDEVSS